MKFLLITGSYRSGTTYLYKAFQNNKNCSLLYQPSIKFFKILDQEIRIKLKKKSFKNFPLGITKINKNLRLNNIFLKKKKILNIIVSLMTLEDKNFIFYKKFYENIKLQNDNIDAENYINILFKSIKQIEKNKKKIYGIKEPFIGDILKLLINIKNLYIINLIRDPREIVYSRNYSSHKNHNDFKNKKHPVILSSLICNRNMEVDLKLTKSNKYKTIKFDELINNHKKIEKKIFKFLNLKISLNINKIKKKNNWKINSSGSKGNFGANWSSQIKKDELAIVEKICGKNFKKYNFTKQSKKKLCSENLIKNFCENPKKILSWTNKKIFLKYLPKEIAKL